MRKTQSLGSCAHHGNLGTSQPLSGPQFLYLYHEGASGALRDCNSWLPTPLPALKFQEVESEQSGKGPEASELCPEPPVQESPQHLPDGGLSPPGPVHLREGDSYLFGEQL